MKLSEASTTIAYDTFVVTSTVYVARQLGKTWRAMIRALEPPAACAASTNGVAMMDSATARSVRAAVGVSKMVSATMTLLTDWPMAAISQSASTIGGRALAASTKRRMSVPVMYPPEALTQPQR